jgi:hypothetical protein
MIECNMTVEDFMKCPELLTKDGPLLDANYNCRHCKQPIPGHLGLFMIYMHPT